MSGRSGLARAGWSDHEHQRRSAAHRCGSSSLRIIDGRWHGLGVALAHRCIANSWPRTVSVVRHRSVTCSATGRPSRRRNSCVRPLRTEPDAVSLGLSRQLVDAGHHLGCTDALGRKEGCDVPGDVRPQPRRDSSDTRRSASAINSVVAQVTLLRPAAEAADGELLRFEADRSCLVGPRVVQCRPVHARGPWPDETTVRLCVRARRSSAGRGRRRRARHSTAGSAPSSFALTCGVAATRPRARLRDAGHVGRALDRPFPADTESPGRAPRGRAAS